MVFNLAYEMIGVAGSHFGTHGHLIDLFIITTVREWNDGKDPTTGATILSNKIEMSSVGQLKAETIAGKVGLGC